MVEPSSEIQRSARSSVEIQPSGQREISDSEGDSVMPVPGTINLETDVLLGFQRNLYLNSSDQVVQNNLVIMRTADGRLYGQKMRGLGHRKSEVSL